MMTNLTQIYGFVKQHKIYFIILICIIVFAFITMKQNLKYADLINEINTSHSQEISDLKKIQQDSDKKQQQNLEQLTKQLADIDQKYNDQITKLNQKTKSAADKIVKETENNPDELAKRLSESTGFTIVGGK
jgi:F0F1-type ATP synthase membrane subunit b/b'